MKLADLFMNLIKRAIYILTHIQTFLINFKYHLKQLKTMRKLLILSVATLLVGLLSVTEAQAQEAVKEEVATIVKAYEKKSCCSKSDSKKECKGKSAKKEKVAEAKACKGKAKGEKSCCKPAAKKEETTPASN